jgi:hypothetical protein
MQFSRASCGVRFVDLCSPLANVQAFIGHLKSGLLFQTSSGRQMSQRNILRDSLHPILEKLGHEKGGLNIFRRYRITKLGTAGCPKDLQHFWSAHAPTHVSELYTQLQNDRDFRLEWAEKIGAGFSIGNPGNPLTFRKAS